MGQVENLGIANWGWLTEGRLKKETEGMMMAAQDQALTYKKHESECVRGDGFG